MVEPVTQNKQLAQPPNASDVGVWDVPVNSNSEAIDASFGDVTQLNAGGLSGVQPSLTLTQYRPCNIVITGSPTPAPAPPVTYQLPLNVGGFYFVSNQCGGTNNAVNFRSASGGPAVQIPGGVNAAIVIDPTNGARLADTVAEQAAGPQGAVQYVSINGLFAGSAGLIFQAGTQTLLLGGPLNVGGTLNVAGFVTSRLILNQGGANTRSVAIPYSATGMAMNCALSNVFASTLNGNVTGAVVISHQDDGQTINWRIQQDATGHRTMAWPSNFRWPGGAAPALSTAPNSVDLLVATFFSSTGTWLSSLLKGFA